MSVQTQTAAPATLPSATTIATEIVGGEHRQIVVQAPTSNPRVLITTRTVAVAAGIITLGAREISVTNFGTGIGSLNGQPLRPNDSYTYSMSHVGEVYNAISYDAAGTQFDILEVR